MSKNFLRYINTSLFCVRKCLGPNVYGCPDLKRVLTPPPSKLEGSARVISQLPNRDSSCTAVQPPNPPPIINAFFNVSMAKC